MTASPVEAAFSAPSSEAPFREARWAALRWPALRWPALRWIGRRLGAGRIRTFVAIAIVAPLIGMEVGMLLARPAEHAPVGLRGPIGKPPALRGRLDETAYLAASAAAPFVLTAREASDHARARRCLADAIYYEAALEPIEGRRAVAQVVLNRVRAPNFPKSVCGVVYDGWKNVAGCQFSFACDGSLARPPVPGLYRNALDLAEQALSGHVEPEVGLATHYHATSVDPAWRADMVRVAQVGSQIFYRWPGAAGGMGAFSGRYAGGEQVPTASALLARAKSNPAPTMAPALQAAADQTSTDDHPAYLYGRRVRSLAEIARMSQLLEERRPSTGTKAAPTS